MLHSHQLISMIQAERELSLARWQLVQAGLESSRRERTARGLLGRIRAFARGTSLERGRAAASPATAACC